MSKKLIITVGILGLAAITLLSMASHSTAEKGGKKGKPGLYFVSITINGEYGFGASDSCSGSFYAEEGGAAGCLLNIVSGGSNTPGPEGQSEPLQMAVQLDDVTTTLLKTCPYVADPCLESCVFDTELYCHGESDRSPGAFHLYIYDETAWAEPGEEIMILWMLDSEDVVSDPPKKRPKGHLWYIQSNQEPPYVNMVDSFPREGLEVGDSFATDVMGIFTLHHQGQACVGDEDVHNSVNLGEFNINLFIERVQ